MRGKLCQLDEETIVDQWNIKCVNLLKIVLDYIYDEVISIKYFTINYCRVCDLVFCICNL